MKIGWPEPARQDLKEIFEYIAEENPNATSALLAEIRKRVNSLADNPQRAALTELKDHLKVHKWVQ